VIKKLSSVVLVQIDCEKGKGIDIAKEYNVKGYPTFILVNKDGESLYRWWGYSKEILFEQLNLGFSDLTTIAEKEKRYKVKPDANTAKALASFYNTQGDIKKSVKFYEDAAKYDPDNDFAAELFQIYYTGYRQNVYTIQEMQTVAENAVSSKQVDDNAKTGIYAQMSGVIKANPKDEKMLSFLIQGYEHISTHQKDAPKGATDAINVSYALYIEKNEKKAIELKKSSYKDGWQDNPGDLNGFAWWCFESKINLEEAQQFGQRGVKLAKPGHEKAMILDTVAEIANLDGSPGESIDLIEQALIEDPDNEYYQKQLDRFKKLVIN
jgi:tetratricopeptide (TPR) repeat protein